jgi:ubiquinone/menaquinone biosynthesis C-methylase UbiE
MLTWSMDADQLSTLPFASAFTRRSPTARRNGMLEMLDSDPLPGELSGNLREIRGINHGLGWTAVTLRLIERLQHEEGLTRWSYLDVATGSADLPLALLRQARRRRQIVDIHALDASPAVLAEAMRYLRGAPVTLHLGDARALPFPDRAFDVVTCALALHHFPRHEAVVVFRELARVARRAWVVVDLRRSLLAYLGALSLRQILRNPMTRHDAPASVLRAYTIPEIEDMLQDAGLGKVTVTARFPFRLAVVGRVAPAVED